MSNKKSNAEVVSQSQQDPRAPYTLTIYQENYDGKSVQTVVLCPVRAGVTEVAQKIEI